MALTDRDIDKLSTALAGKLHAQCPLGLMTEDIAAIRYVVDLLQDLSQPSRVASNFSKIHGYFLLPARKTLGF